MNGREGRAEKAFKKELHLNVFISEMYAIKLPFSSQDKKKSIFNFNFTRSTKPHTS